MSKLTPPVGPHKNDDFLTRISRGLKKIGEQISDVTEWVSGLLQGAWNPNMTVGQIISDAVLGLMPVIGVALDVRDLCACIYRLRQSYDKKPNNEQEIAFGWLDLAINIIGCMPVQGDLAKPVLKIIFKNIRHYGLDKLDIAIQTAVVQIKRMMNDERLVKLIGHNNIGRAYKAAAAYCRKTSAGLNVDHILQTWETLNKELFRISKYGWISNDAAAKLDILLGESSTFYTSTSVRSKLQNTFGDIKRILNLIADTLDQPAPAQLAAVNRHTTVKLNRHKSAVVVKRADRRKLGCFSPSSQKVNRLKKQGEKEYRKFEKEYYRQLKDQETGLNGLTIDEYLAGREAYKANGRGAGKSQAKTRTDYEKKIRNSLEKTYQKRGKSESEAKNLAEARSKAIVKELDALHNPDRVAGGKDVTGRLGRRDVNRSIGGNWNQKPPEAGSGLTRLQQLDAYAEEMKRKHGGDANMNVELNRCTLTERKSP